MRMKRNQDVYIIPKEISVLIVYHKNHQTAIVSKKNENKCLRAQSVNYFTLFFFKHHLKHILIQSNLIKMILLSQIID